MKILIADDEMLVLEILRFVLEDLGHETIAVSDGAEAETEFRRHKPRVVIADWRMPGLSGLELCRKIRAGTNVEYPYFILQTGNDPNERNIEEAMEAGVDDFLNKPVDATQIKSRLRVADRIVGLTQRVLDLETVVPICSYCRRIRREDGYFESVEVGSAIR